MRKAVAGLLVLLLVAGTGLLKYTHVPFPGASTAASPVVVQTNPPQVVEQHLVRQATAANFRLNQGATAASPVHGVIEGFYGQPWSYPQRVSMLRYMAAHQFNTYVYAPKDDPYQAADWRLPYPGPLLQQMASLVYAAQANGVQFVYSISPGLLQPLPHSTVQPGAAARSITFTSAADTRQLETKIDQLRSIGVHTFLLSLDDVQRSLKAQDANVYGSDFARAHIDLVNRVFRDETQKDAQFQLWFVPTVYYGLQDNDYWHNIRTRLDPSVKVVWTGSWVLNRQITSQQARQVTQLLGRKPLLWDNYPVNDYTYATEHAPALFMGPLRGRSADLLPQLAGYIANPMLQPEASKLPLATIGQYLAGPQDYSPDAAWVEAVQAMDGVGDVRAFQTFCAYADDSVLNSSGDQAFTAMAASFWSDRKSGRRSTAERSLRQELQTLAQLPVRLRETVSNHSLETEIDPWVTKLGEEGTVGLLALTYLDTPRTRAERAGERQELATRWKLLQQNPLHTGDAVARFIQQALEQ